MARGKPAEKGKILERQIHALEFRKSGFSYRAIGERLGTSQMQAYRDIQNELKRLAEISLESAAELRQMELERLDMAIKGLMPFIEAGSASHAMALVKVIAERAKLLGLYAPEKVQAITWEDQAIADIRAGNIVYEDLAEAFDDSLASRLFAAAGVPISTE